MKVRKKENLKQEFSANVSTLKTHLGQFLKRVRAGAEIVVLDRQLPIAKIVGLSGPDDLVEIPPTLTWREAVLQLATNDKRRRPTKLKKDLLVYLDEDRGVK